LIWAANFRSLLIFKVSFKQRQANKFRIEETMNKIKFVICVALLMLTHGTTVAQTHAPASPASDAVKRVSAQQLKVTIEKLVSFGTRNTISAATPEAIQSGRGIGAAREWIKGEFERYSKECGGCLEVKTDSVINGPAPRIPQPTEIVNVYAILRGTDAVNAKRIYLISGHYDSRGTDTLDTKGDAPGANDDGSGVAVVLEAARVLSKHKFPATIIFLAVAGEEQGLNGSKHFAKMAKEQGWDVQAVLNDDTVGGDRSPGQKNFLRVFAEGIPLNDLDGNGDVKALRRIRALGTENDSNSRELARYVEEIAGKRAQNARATTGGTPALQTKVIYRPDRYLRGGDHTSFNEQGFAAVRLTEWRENYDRQHQNPRTENGIEYGDLPKFVNYEYMANVARLNVTALASLASAPASPANVRLLTKELTNDSTLAWDAPAGGLVDHYEVVWRDTTSPVWQNAQTVPGTATRATVDVSKDNVIFGLRTVAKNGSKSMAVVPMPER
jgi:Zn-dependent M28 family amino/carboxypeptidase